MSTIFQIRSRLPDLGPARRQTSTLAAVLALLLGLTGVAQTASALTISIKGISGKSGGYTPNDRLGLGESTAGGTTITHTINRADCEAIQKASSALIDITWKWSDYAATAGISGITGSPRYTIKIAPPGVTCSETEMTKSTSNPECIVPYEQVNFGSILTQNEVAEVNLKQLLGKTACDANTEDKALIYFIVDDPKIVGLQAGAATLTVTIDLQPPAAPTGVAIKPGDGQLHVSWDAVSSSTKPDYRVYWSETKTSIGQAASSSVGSQFVAGTNTGYRIEGLDNGKTYWVAVAALDANSNESPTTTPIQGAPVSVDDLWEHYKRQGGASEGGYYGCSARPSGAVGADSPSGTGGTALLLLAGLGLLLLLRRGRKTGLVALLLVVGVSTLLPQRARAESPRTMSLDVRGSYYEPAIDREFEGTTKTPYADIMTTPTLEYSVAVDWRLWHGFGEVGVGFSLGYWSQDGSALYSGGAGKSADTTSLLIVPVTLDLIYRFNVLAERFRFPLVPYVKGGLAYGFWWMNGGTGETSTYTTKDPVTGKDKVLTGKGGVAGFQGTIGMRLLLDVFEPKAARGFDIEMGVNHSYLFIEYQKLVLTNFGSDPKVLDLSQDGLVQFGLAFDL